jgi:hypothetical protein
MMKEFYLLPGVGKARYRLGYMRVDSGKMAVP